MKDCPLCGLAFENTDLTRHYLSDARLVRFIRQTFKNWNPEDGACSRCLEDHYRNYNSQSLSGAYQVKLREDEEKTVITATDDVLSSPPSDETPCLVTIMGTNLGERFDIPEGEIIIGRSETAHIRILGENVSRQHSKIFRQAGETIIEDLDSTNGTLVNTRKITSQPLKDNDLVFIGNTVLKFMSGTNIETRYHQEIYRLATLDGLTQAFNKNHFLEKLADEFSRSFRYRRDLSLIIFDFDHFKSINDTYGHQAGDHVLKKSAYLIMKNLRKEDIYGRYGGEEFGVLLPETSFSQAIRIAEKIRELIDKTEFVAGDQKIHATISVGVTSLKKSHRDVQDLIQAADRALYQAKKQGRNRVESES